MNAPKVALGDEFLESFALIPKGKQKKVMEFVAKFRHDPKASGINYEAINDAKDPNFRSVRIDLEYRGIVLRPEKGDVYILLWVDKHDDAYQWARRHSCHIHPTTGVLQLMAMDRMEEAEAAPVPTVVQKASATPILALPADVLLRLGVPEFRLDWVRSLTQVEALEDGKALLPLEAFEALYLLAGGISLEEILAEYAPQIQAPVDVTDFAGALDLPASRRRFVVVEDEMELLEMLEAPLEKWRVFLHPSQRRLVERHWNGPVRVLGGAGTGKTVVAMHRAKWLAQHVAGAGEKVLLTTFTRNLAMDIEENLRKICPADLMSRIEITNLDAWVSRYLKSRNHGCRIVYPGGDNHEYDGCWQKAMAHVPAGLGLPQTFYHEEWERIVLPQNLQTLKDYQIASRAGRGVALNRKQRTEIWPVFEEMRLQLSQHQPAPLMTIEDAVHEAIALLDKGRSGTNYRSVVVDETQDFGSEMLTLLRRLLPPSNDDLFLVGDGHQRIYRRKAVLGRCGIEVKGRSHKLKINYRTTEEIRTFATAILEGAAIDDLDAGSDSAKGYRSLTHGERPEVQVLGSFEKECDWIQEQMDELAAEGMRQRDVCIAVRTNLLLERMEKELKAREITTQRLSRQRTDNRNQEGVRLATMHRIKGLEFKVIFLVCVNDGVVPLKQATADTEDPVELNRAEIAERALFHVAATRAVQHLFISCHGKMSGYLDQHADR